MTGSSFLSQGLPPAPYLGRNTKDLLSSKEAAPAVKSQEGENRKVRLVYSCQGLGLCHERSQVSPAHSHVRKLVHGCYDMPIDSAPLFPSPSSAPAWALRPHLLDHTHKLSHFPQCWLSTVPRGLWLGSLSLLSHWKKSSPRSLVQSSVPSSLPWDPCSTSQQGLSPLLTKERDRCVKQQKHVHFIHQLSQARIACLP